MKLYLLSYRASFENFLCNSYYIDSRYPHNTYLHKIEWRLLKSDRNKLFFFDEILNLLVINEYNVYVHKESEKKKKSIQSYESTCGLWTTAEVGLSSVASECTLWKWSCSSQACRWPLPIGWPVLDSSYASYHSSPSKPYR